MPEEKEADLNIVQSIFGESRKKEVSSLFTHKPAKRSPQSANLPKSVSREAKKILPFGLDIGTSSIKILQLSSEQKNSVINIERIIIEDIPRQVQENPKEMPGALADILRKIFGERGLKGDCFCALPNALNKVGLITLPQMSASEIDKALRWEIRQATQTDINEIALDYVLLENQSRFFLPSQIGILAVTALKKDALEYLAFLEAAGVRPLALDAEPLANFAVLDYLGVLEPDKAALFVDFGAGKSILSVVCNKELVFIRPLNITGNSITKAISDYCGVTWQEAEGLKKSFGLPDIGDKQAVNQPQDKAVQIRNAVLPLFENMAQDIEHAFKYFSLQVSRSKITAFDRVILSGGASCMNSFAPFLESRLNVKVEALNPISRFKIADSNYQAGIENLGPRLSVALGLALRGVL